MQDNIIDGRQIAQEIQSTVAVQVERFAERGIQPTLAIVLVGEDPASQAYIRSKKSACESVGFKFLLEHLESNITDQVLHKKVSTLSSDRDINGILVQLPLPSHLDRGALYAGIPHYKDVDGFHPYNIGKLCQRTPCLRPCTPMGVMRLLEKTEVPLLGKDALVIGASEIVGRPMALELLMAGCTVTVAHRFTNDLEAKVGQADIVIVAVGKPNLVKGHWIKPGATVIDIGITRLPNGTLTGDVEFEEACTRAQWITPVPGGVGPMTVACLLENTLRATCLQNETEFDLG